MLETHTTFLALDTHAFCAGGDELFSAGDEHVENVCSNFSHTHTHTHSEMCTFTLGRSESYVDAQQRHLRPNLECSRLEALVFRP